jgi:hypothetical protein
VSAWFAEERIDAGNFALRLAQGLAASSETQSQVAKGFKARPQSVWRPSYAAGLRVYRGEGPEFRLLHATIPMRHDTDRPFQVGSQRDSPNAAQRYSFDVRDGDVIVAGSDGLWDVLDDVAPCLALAEPSKMAWHLGSLAFQASERRGELDDITVIVAKVALKN